MSWWSVSEPEHVSSGTPNSRSMLGQSRRSRHPGVSGRPKSGHSANAAFLIQPSPAHIRQAVGATERQSRITNCGISVRDILYLSSSVGAGSPNTTSAHSTASVSVENGRGLSFSFLFLNFMAAFAIEFCPHAIFCKLKFETILFQ